MFKKILIATDGSENAMRAVEAGRNIAGCFKPEVSIVYAAYVPRMYTGDLRPEILDSLRDDGKRILKAAARLFEGTGVEPSEKLLFDEKAEEGILRLLKEEDYDLVVIGSRGLDARGRKALGSTSMRVLEDASCPVLVVH